MIVACVHGNNTLISRLREIRAAPKLRRLETRGPGTDDNCSVRNERGADMSQPAKAEAVAEPLPPDPYPDYPAPYAWFFQSWLIMFLAVICLALLFYLMSYI